MFANAFHYLRIAWSQPELESWNNRKVADLKVKIKNLKNHKEEALKKEKKAEKKKRQKAKKEEVNLF